MVGFIAIYLPVVYWHDERVLALTRERHEISLCY